MGFYAAPRFSQADAQLAPGYSASQTDTSAGTAPRYYRVCYLAQ